MSAKVARLSPAADPTTHTYSIKLDIAAPGLRSGSFARVLFPTGKRSVLAVPAAAVMRHEGRAFVFTPADTEGFRRIDIETGIEADDFVEVKRGLEPGQKIVAKGAFLLKSELLLEDEG